MADEIRTERLVLRRARLDDAPAMHAIMSDAKAMRFWSSLPHATLAETERWMESMIEVDARESDDFIVTLEGVVIGKLGAWKLPEFGFLLDRAQWHKGYAGEALAAFIAHRRACGAAELKADVDPRNLASLRLLQRHGFVETGRTSGTWRIGDELCDSIDLRLAL
ncbi:MAG: GNAT family N-acetyltransferase [Pseudomonadota bacterium]|nr:GNAT family N-acetyltransferase [Pseudomonadota bacterium]